MKGREDVNGDYSLGLRGGSFNATGSDFGNMTTPPPDFASAMAKLNQLGAFVILFLTMFATPGKGMQISQCRGVDIDLGEHNAVHVSICLKQAGAKEIALIDPDKMACFVKCVFDKKGMFDERGMPDEGKMVKFINDQMPVVAREDLTRSVGACLSPNTTGTIDPGDPSCRTYVPVLLCINLAFLIDCAQI